MFLVPKIKSNVYLTLFFFGGYKIMFIFYHLWGRIENGIENDICFSDFPYRFLSLKTYFHTSLLHKFER